MVLSGSLTNRTRVVISVKVYDLEDALQNTANYTVVLKYSIHPIIQLLRSRYLKNKQILFQKNANKAQYFKYLIYRTNDTLIEEYSTYQILSSLLFLWGTHFADYLVDCLKLEELCA